MTRDIVQIWYGTTDDDANYLNYWAVLDANEQARAEKFANELLKKRYVLAHGLLRHILAQQLDVPPEKIIFAIAERGKPYLPERPELAFSLSHSANALLIAVGWYCQLGVDLEKVRSRVGLQGLVEKCFAEEEIAYWNSLPKTLQISEFYKFWTRKEALVKATGHGIAVGLNQCVINPENPLEFLRVPSVCGSASSWRVLNIELGMDESCAVVTDKVLFDYRVLKLLPNLLPDGLY